MGLCCVNKHFDITDGINVKELPQKNETILKYINNDFGQNDDWSVLVTNYNNELNYNVKYKESNNKKVISTKRNKQSY